jgi:hypothetical protein
MKLIFDRAAYDNYQAVLVREIVAKIRLKLAQAGIEGSQLQELTASIGSSITSIIDDTTVIQDGDIAAHPFLAFVNDDEEIVHTEENAYTHEFLYDALKKEFS